MRLHVGIASGRVFAGEVEVSGRHEYSIMGDAVNLAARLCQKARAAETLVGPEIRLRTGHVARFECADSVKLEGRRASIAPHRLLDRKASVAGARASGAASSITVQGISSPLVGREGELDRLADALKDDGDGRGRIVLVSGEAGIGKSRLTAELRMTLQGRRLLWREGRAVSHGESLSYQPFLQILEQDLGYEPADDEDRRYEKLVGRAQEVFQERTDEFVPYLATLLNLRLPDDLDLHLGALDSASMGHQVFRAVLRYIGTAARQRPLAVVFEDVHWMDQSSVALVEHILPLVREVPLVVCVCGRPDPGSPTMRLTEAARVGYADRCAEIDLAPLTQAKSRSLLNNLVGAGALPPGLAQSMLEKAGGNPFFLEEQLRALIDLGWLVPQNGAWRLTHGVDELSIPDKLQDVITARIDLLEAGTRHVLRLASVIGRSFTLSLLRAADEECVDLEPSLMRLQESQMIQAKRGGGELEYAFKHALVQETAYESILHPRRRELHARVARGHEALFADRLPDVYSLLAYHYARAEEWEKAQHYLLRAGDQAGRIAADAEALEHYRRALAAYGQVFGDRWDPVDRAAVERRMGEALFHLGKHEEARRHLDRALSVLGRPLPTSPRALRRAVVREVLVQISHRLLPARLWRLGRRLGDRAITEHCDVLCTIAWIETLGSPDRLMLANLRLLNEAETASLVDQRMRGLLFANIVCLILPSRWLARRYQGLAVRLAQSTGRPLHIAEANLAVGYYRFAMAQADSALEAFSTVREASVMAGHLPDWLSATANSTVALAERGRLREIPALAQESSLKGAESGISLIGCFGDAIAGIALDHMGQLPEAEARLRRAVGLMLAASDFMDVVLTIAYLVHVLSREGRWDEALRSLRQGEELVVANPRLRTFWNTWFWTLGAEIKVAAAESCEEVGGGEKSGEDRGRARREALSRARLACKQARACVKLYRGAAVPAWRAQGTYEWVAGRKRAALKWWRKSLRAGERLGFTYQLAVTHLEMGRRLGDRAHLETAEKLFSEMGAAFDQQQAQEMLGALSAASPALTTE